MYDTQLKHVESALNALDPNGMDYHEWAKIGRAVADFDNGSLGHGLFHEFSSRYSGYDQKKVDEQWKIFSKQAGARTKIGSLFYEAQRVGWQVEYDSPEEYKNAAEERRRSAAQRKAAREEKARQKAIQDAKDLAKNEREFLKLAPLTSPDPYLQRKQLHTAHNYIDLRQGNHLFLGEFFAWPLYDIDGNWAGYERIFHSPKQPDQNNKMVGKYSRNDIGFYVFGDLSTAERVFVMGGFADALTAHICTGFVTVAVVGEGCIPQIINQLRERYPEKDFVSAPDNDQAGLQVVERAGGEWVVPQGANDWSELYLTRGGDDVRRQLSVAYGWKQVTVEQEKLRIDIRKGVTNKIVSGKGTGKTHSIREFVLGNPELKTLIVSYRVSLLDSLADGFDADLYSNPQMESPGHGLLRGSRRLVCSMDSLWKLAGSHWDLVIMDECEQDFQHMLAATMQHKTLNTDVLAAILKNAHTTVFMDADLGPLTAGFLSQIGIHHGIEFTNTYKPRQDSTMTVHPSKEALSVQIMQAIANGEQVYICSNSKEWLDPLAVKLQQEFDLTEFKDMMIITSDNSQSAEVKEFISQVKDPEYMSRFKVLIGSPSIGTGLDIPEGHPFKKTFAYFSHQSGTTEQAHQQLARARGVTDYHVHVKEVYGKKITDPALISRLILEERDAETIHFLGLKDGELVVSHPLYEWLYCQTTGILNDNFNRFAVRFEKLARHEGYTIEYADQNGRDVKAMKEAMDDIRSELKDKYTQNTQLVPLLSQWAKDKAHAGYYDAARTEVKRAIDTEFTAQKRPVPEYSESELDKLVGISLLKTQVMKDMNLAALKISPEQITELLNELTVEERYTRHVSALKKLSWAFVPAEAAKQQDIKDRKASTSKADLKHRYQQRRLLLRILAAAGLDDQMNLNPDVEWGPKQIRALMRWMQKNRNSLFKYLNITLSEQNYMEPIQWFNTFLRNLKLPVTGRQVREQGTGARYRVYRIDSRDLWPVRELVLNRVDGIVAHLNEEAATNRDVADAQERMNQVNAGTAQPAVAVENIVTPQPIISLINKGECVTPDLPAQASIHAGYAHSEEGTPELEISSPETTPSDRKISSVRDRAMAKIREWFPDLTQETGSAVHQGITDGHLEGYLSDIDIKEIDSGVIDRGAMGSILDILARMGGKSHFES